jgi:hypothetical protein
VEFNKICIKYRSFFEIKISLNLSWRNNVTNNDLPECNLSVYWAEGVSVYCPLWCTGV